MILSVSRRTDIPAFYSDWFYNRVKAGFVYVRNPFFPQQVSRIGIDPERVDCIVFWTKNPGPMLPRLDELKEYPYYFHVTINPYDHRLEAAVPRKNKVIDNFKRLSDRIGPHRVIWRYDPVFRTDGMDMEYLVDSFEAIAQRLSGYTERVMTGFLTRYKKTGRNMQGTAFQELTPEEKLEFARRIAAISTRYGIDPQACSVKADLSGCGVKAGYCIEKELVERLSGYPISARKDRNQREVCRCIESIDIGEYDTCPHGCLYCYANQNQRNVAEKWKRHDPGSPLLIGYPQANDIVTDRKPGSHRSAELFR